MKIFKKDIAQMRWMKKIGNYCQRLRDDYSAIKKICSINVTENILK